MGEQGFTATEAAVMAPVLMAHTTGVHDAVVIEGIEHRARVFGREVPAEQDIREAISSLLASKRIIRNDKGWLCNPGAKP